MRPAQRKHRVELKPHCSKVSKPLEHHIVALFLGGVGGHLTAIGTVAVVLFHHGVKRGFPARFTGFSVVFYCLHHHWSSQYVSVNSPAFVAVFANKALFWTEGLAIVLRHNALTHGVSFLSPFDQTGSYVGLSHAMESRVLKTV